MKIARFLPLLAIIVAMGSAFSVKQNTDTEYYTTDGVNFTEKEGPGSCEPSDYNCSYIANKANPDLGNPADFDAIGTPNRVFSPSR
ncbi:MAG: hypothetical protein JO301_11340 [Chitinophagaceae bacterium]|nr:hypothetical protein [Chitinophagaceae bacterium]